MSDAAQEAKELSLEKIISTSVQIPGVKVNRTAFLEETFSSFSEIKSQIIELGPIAAGVSQDDISKIARKHIIKRTSQSSVASFVAGIPGGLAMAATIPLDIAQFFGMALRLAQELSYLYGAEDLWKNGDLNDDRVKNQLILYCGVMFGVSGAVSGVRVLSTQIAKTTLKKLPQKALTKTFWYPIIKSIGKAIGVKITKTTVAHGVSKAVPVLGGVISGSLNFASMMPMANRLNETLDKACFYYSEEEFNADIENLETISEETEESGTESSTPQEFIKSGLEHAKTSLKSAEDGLSKAFKKVSFGKKKEDPYEIQIVSIRKFKELLDEGIITQEEFDAKKKEIIG